MDYHISTTANITEIIKFIHPHKWSHFPFVNFFVDYIIVYSLVSRILSHQTESNVKLSKIKT